MPAVSPRDATASHLCWPWQYTSIGKPWKVICGACGKAFKCRIPIGYLVTAPCPHCHTHNIWETDVGD